MHPYSIPVHTTADKHADVLILESNIGVIFFKTMVSFDCSRNFGPLLSGWLYVLFLTCLSKCSSVASKSL